MSWQQTVDLITGMNERRQTRLEDHPAIRENPMGVKAWPGRHHDGGGH